MKSVRCWIKDPFPGLSHWAGVGLSLSGLVTLLVLVLLLIVMYASQ